jgi:exonuclease III
VVNFGLWNIDSLRDADEREFPRLVAEFAHEHSLDVVCLVESSTIAYDRLLSSFPDTSEYFAIPCSERFKILTRFNPRFMTPLESPVANDRFQMWHVELPLQESILLVVVHGLDKGTSSIGRQELFFQQVREALTFHEAKVGHDRTVVMGDLNANPFESPIGSTSGMNAVMTRAIAKGGERVVLNRSYSFFYNPMWNLFGDDPTDDAPGTYYYRGPDPHELYWHMLDQVLVRPSLIDRFDIGSLGIVKTIGTDRLHRNTGIPNRTHYSDHFPIVFGLNLSLRD